MWTFPVGAQISPREVEESQARINTIREELKMVTNLDLFYKLWLAMSMDRFINGFKTVLGSS